MEFLIILLLIILNGFFAMSEIAMISARRSNLEMQARQGDAGARQAQKLIEDPDKFLSTIQIGITLIGILTGIYSGDALATKFGRELAALGISLRTATVVAQITIVIVVTYLTLIFGELVPKRIGMNSAEKIAKLAALSGYTTITTQMIQQLGTVTLDADTFDMVKLVAAGNTRQALAKLQTLLELQNEPILITGALIGNYLDIYRAFLAKKSRRPLADLAKDFKYTGKWNYRLGNADQTAARFQRSQIEESLRILQKLDLDLKGSRLDAPLLMQKAICELSLARSRA